MVFTDYMTSTRKFKSNYLGLNQGAWAQKGNMVWNKDIKLHDNDLHWCLT